MLEEEDEATLRIFAGNKTREPRGDSAGLWMVSPGLPAGSAPGSAADPRSHMRGACWKRTCSLRRATQHRRTASPSQAAYAKRSWQPRDHAWASTPKHLLSSEKHPSPFPLLSTTTQITATVWSQSFPKRCCSGPGRHALPCSYSEVTVPRRKNWPGPYSAPVSPLLCCKRG